MIKPDKVYQKEEKKISVKIPENNQGNKDFRNQIPEREDTLIQMSTAFISTFPTQASADSRPQRLSRKK